jgi:hypothetical protein
MSVEVLGHLVGDSLRRYNRIFLLSHFFYSLDIPAIFTFEPPLMLHFV